MSERVELRAVRDEDIEIFYEDQLDSAGAAMAAFAPRDRDGHFAHWKKIMADDTNVLRTITHENRVVGNVVSWVQDDRRLVGYWVSRKSWGRGFATMALRQFTALLPDRPLYAFVARHNVGSIRVLEKCGFAMSDEETRFEDEVEELTMVLA